MIVINDDRAAVSVLENTAADYRIVDLADDRANWESRIICDDRVGVWVDDRLDTTATHASNVKAHGVPLVTFDDRGSGANAADLHVAGMSFDETEPLGGARVLRGTRYLVLDPDIRRRRRLRREAARLLVSIGGTDTHGVTPRVVSWLRAAGRPATVVVGPGFAHARELDAATGGEFDVRRNVPSLVAEFVHHDIAITAGGITPFEANASGLPCLIIATEPAEIGNARELERRGSSVFLGSRDDVDGTAVALRSIDVEAMSRAGLSQLDADGADRVAAELLRL